MKKYKNEKYTKFKKKENQIDEEQDIMFEIDAFYFEKENHRKKRETAKRKKQERRTKEDKWN